jgi:hypothetical protein
MENLKERHGCVSAWLWMVIVVNLCFCVYYFMTMLDSESSQSLGYGFLSSLSVFLILGAILLMRWSRCGFYLMVGTSLLTLIVNHFLLEIEVGYSIPGILGILFWWVILQIRKNGVSAWKLMDTTWDYKHCRHLYQVFLATVLLIVFVSVFHSFNEGSVVDNQPKSYASIGSASKEISEESENNIEWTQFLADDKSCKIEAPADFRKAKLNENQLFALICTDYDPAFVAFSESLKNATAVGVYTSKQYAQVVVKNNCNAPGAEKYKKIAERQLSNGGYVICYDLTIDGTAFRYNLVAIKSKTAFYYGLIYCLEEYAGKVEPIMSHMVNSFQTMK